MAKKIVLIPKRKITEYEIESVLLGRALERLNALLQGRINETATLSGDDLTSHVAAGDPHTGYTLESLFDAHTVLQATSDNTPAALSVAEQTLVGRLTGGNISAVTLGIADNNVVQMDDADATDDDYVKLTANGLEGRSYAEVKSDLGLTGADSNKITSALSSDHTWSGIRSDMTAGTNLTIGQSCYIGSDSKMEKTDADAEATMPAVALVCETIAEDATGEFLLFGFMRDDTWNWTPGAQLWASTTLGGITETAPSGSLDIQQIVGFALTADIIFWKPSMNYFEV